MMTYVRIGFVLLGVTGAVACMPEPEMIDGALAFQQDCAACHGPSGTGDGELAAQLSRIPPDLTGLSAANGGVYPRDYVIGVIDGFDRGDHFAPDMPAFGDGDMGPTIIVENDDGTGTPIPERLLALSEYIERIQR